MQDPSRPNPDVLLAAIKQEDDRHRRGRLTVFLGMCAGVGKTYAMLKMAHQRKSEGTDLVVAVVETHRRTETQALLEGLPAIPLRLVEYRGATLPEMDLDALLQRHPTLALVDELAHSNAPTSRHPKRYQDVLELLDAGIDVYSTLNIQHIESRVDLVRQITGVTIRETVPDTVLDQATDIQLVDLTPDSLRERLAEGKVYLGTMAQTAASNFFKEENLTALRELALRATAEHVNQELRDVMTTRQITGAWKTNAKLMVAIGPSPYSAELIRWTRRAVSVMGAQWVAVYVESLLPLSEEETARLAKTLSLARQLGAQVVATTGDDLVKTLLRVAREERVTQLVIGKTLDSPLREFFKGGSLVDRLIRESGDLDVCVVQTGQSQGPHLTPPGKPFDFTPWSHDITLGTVSIALVTAICWLIRDVTGYWAIALVYLFLIILLATQLQRRAILITAAASALLWDFLFIPPVFTLHINQVHDILMFVMYFIVALVIGNLTARLRLREWSERKREQRTAALYRLAQGVAESTTLEEGLRRAIQEIQNVSGTQCAVLLVGQDGRLSQTQHPAGMWTLTEKERGVALWSLEHREPAGRHTDTLPESDCLHLPLKTANNKVGVLALHFPDRKPLLLDERELLETFADQIAVMIERYWLIQEAGRTQLAEESEKLYKTLFDCVSHEIKTPLAVIQAATGELGLVFDLIKEAKGAQPFLKEIETASRRLGRIVDNLISMTRIESGRYTLAPAWCDVDEIISSAQQQVGDLLSRHQVHVLIPSDFPSVKVDSGFVEQSLANLTANAALYTEPGSEITISAQVDESHLVLRVSDQGPGLPPGGETRVFEKFFRGPQAPSGGIGLGLSIVKGLMNALQGTVSAVNNPDRGATFTLRIPVEMKRIPESI
ncbi:MAG: sensor histidine kinase KdpD [bacterium]